jgi:hypothetical protein
MDTGEPTIKVLVQTRPSANVLTAILTVAATTKVLVQKIFLTNNGNGAEKVSMSLALRGAADDISQYFLTDYSLASKGYITLEPAVTLEATDAIRAKTDGDICITILGQTV